MASPGPSPAPRCAVCGWPLDPDEKFCRVGDCSMRPLPTVLRDPDRAIAEYSASWGPQHVPASWHEQARIAALPAPARPTAEQIALVEQVAQGRAHRATEAFRPSAEREHHQKVADALSALLTAVTGKDTP